MATNDCMDKRRKSQSRKEYMRAWRMDMLQPGRVPEGSDGKQQALHEHHANMTQGVSRCINSNGQRSVDELWTSGQATSHPVFNLICIPNKTKTPVQHCLT